MQELHLYQVDAFTDRAFTGNPAAVCILTKEMDDAWMQNLAREMNLSETAFLLPENDGFRLRWFTPTVEVDLCGHATLASAHVLWEAGYLWPTETARFFTRSGLLTAQQQGEWIELDFPATVAEEVEAPEGLIDALETVPMFVGKNRFDYLIEVESEEDVRRIEPDFRRLRELPVRGVIVTSKASTDGFDFVSRFFAPGSGVDEDPVTGSAHCTLGPYWRAQLGKNEMIAYQASARGGVVQVRTAGDRIFLGGKAVTILRGELT